MDGLANMLQGASKVAMQYSPNCQVPYVAMVDAGTVESIRSIGPEVVTAANLIQLFESRWTAQQLESHLEAGRRVDRIRAEAFTKISDAVRAGTRVTEWEMQQFILGRFREDDLFTDHGPDVAVNANASNPHYDPKQDACSQIQSGDLVLIDMWAKLNQPGAVYYDITWTGFCGPTPPSDIQNIFGIVRDARDKAVECVTDAIARKRDLCGYQVDDA